MHLADEISRQQDLVLIDQLAEAAVNKQKPLERDSSDLVVHLRPFSAQDAQIMMSRTIEITVSNLSL